MICLSIKVLCMSVKVVCVCQSRSIRCVSVSIKVLCLSIQVLCLYLSKSSVSQSRLACPLPTALIHPIGRIKGIQSSLFSRQRAPYDPALLRGVTRSSGRALHGRRLAVPRPAWDASLPVGSLVLLPLLPSPPLEVRCAGGECDLKSCRKLSNCFVAYPSRLLQFHLFVLLTSLTISFGSNPLLLARGGGVTPFG